MPLYLCSECNSIVYEDEKCNHSCVSDQNDDEVCAEPIPDASEEMERQNEKSKGVPSVGHLNDYTRNTCPSVQQNVVDNWNEATSLLADHEHISFLPPSSRKRKHDSMSTSESLGGAMESGPPSSSQRESGESEVVAKKSKNCSTIRSASSPVLPGGCSPSGELHPDIVVPAPASDAAATSVAGPSGVQAQATKTVSAYLCDECEKSFARRADYERHYRTHTGDKPFACPKCDKSFSLKGNLTTHLRTHTGERPFECEICGKKFAEKAALTKHLRTHTGEKPYSCEYCGKEFAKSSNCKDHQMRKHGKK